jgi:hypothetical protein
MVETPQNYTGDLLTLDDVFNNEISIFKNYFGIDVIENTTIKNFLFDVKNGKYQKEILKLRNTPLAENRKKIKQNLNAVTLSCKCKSRNKDIADRLITHSNLIQIDIDKLDAQKFAATNKLIQNDKHTLFSFVSPSGTGYKIGVQIDSNYHRESFEMLIKYYKDTYNIDIDTQTGDLFRLLTYSFDSELFINPNATKFDFDIADYNKSKPQLVEYQNNAISNAIQRDYFLNNEILDKQYSNALKTCKEMLNNSIDGVNRNYTRLSVGRILGGYIGGGWISEIDAINDIKNEVERNTDDIKKAFKDIKNGIKFGIKSPFSKEIEMQKHNDYLANLKSNKTTKNNTKKTKNLEAANLNEIVNKSTGEVTEINLPFCFWNEIENNKTPQLKIDVKQLYDFLANNGFGLIKIDGKDLPILCRTLDKRISETNTEYLRNFVLNELENLPQQISKNFTKIDLHKLLINGASGYFQKDKYSIAFKIIDYTPFKDSETTSYFFFNNCYVEVTNSYILQKDYKDFDGLIWDSQVINHNFTKLIDYNDYRDFDFVEFVKNLCTARNTKVLDNNRLAALHSIIGYLLHTYRSPSNTKAVVLTEADTTGYAQGGTGKGLLLQSINKLRKVTNIDGKNFKFDNQFALQNVTLDTQIILLDDVSKDFHFERLYSQITEGISFEKKGKERTKLSYENSPKFVITTNFGLKGVSESDKRRQYEMEIMTYYNAEHRPINDFKREFFNDWNDTDYNKFYNFMLSCVKTYFDKVNKSTGFALPKYESPTLLEVKIKANTSVEFIEFISDLEHNISYNYADVYDNYINETGDKISKTTFTKYLKLYAEHYKLRPPTDRKRVKGELQTIIFLTPIEENMYNNVKS